MKPKYPWPASAISEEDMARLYHVRQNATPRVPITELIARAVRQAYAEDHTLTKTPTVPHAIVLHPEHKEAA